MFMPYPIQFLLASSLLVSCSAFVGERQLVTLDGGHPETSIEVDGDPVGAGIVEVELQRDRSHVVIFRRGDDQEVRVIDHVWSIYGKLDALGSIVLLFPGFGLICPGARALEPLALVSTELTE